MVAVIGVVGSAGRWQSWGLLARRQVQMEHARADSSEVVVRFVQIFFLHIHTQTFNAFAPIFAFRLSCIPSSNTSLCGDLQEVLDKIRCVSSQCYKNALCAVVPQDAPRAHRVLNHKTQLGVADAQREQCAQGVVNIRAISDQPSSLSRPIHS